MNIYEPWYNADASSAENLIKPANGRQRTEISRCVIKWGIATPRKWRLLCCCTMNLIPAGDRKCFNLIQQIRCRTIWRRLALRCYNYSTILSINLAYKRHICSLFILHGFKMSKVHAGEQRCVYNIYTMWIRRVCMPSTSYTRALPFIAIVFLLASYPSVLFYTIDTVNNNKDTSRLDILRYW